MSPSELSELVYRCCELDVLALKPGNVSVAAPGHGMSAAQFMASARLAAPILAAPDLGVGEKIRQSARAVLAEVGCNTNLGILLLAAPLCRAANARRPGEDFRHRLQRVLEDLTVADAAGAFAAIHAMRPAGLGRRSEHDVASAPTITLKEAMIHAAAVDRIARQYANGYEDVFERGVPPLERTPPAWCEAPELWSVTHCYLSLLAQLPDSHVLRKYGSAQAEWLLQRAIRVESAFKACENPAHASSLLEDFDEELKSNGINPGTTADLTVASLLAGRLAAS